MMMEKRGRVRYVQRVGWILNPMYGAGSSIMRRSGARGNAKPKKCAKCDGNGWHHVQSQVCRAGSCLVIDSNLAYADLSVTNRYVAYNVHRM